MSTTAVDFIPLITDPMGQGWDQPKRTDILMDKHCAVMTKQTLEKLAKYSCSIPSGVYPGKMWRMDNADYNKPGEYKDRHWLRWFGIHPTDPNKCTIGSVPILLV